MAISPSDNVCLSQNLSFVTNSSEVCSHEAWLTQATWEPAMDTACEKEQEIQELTEPER